MTLFLLADMLSQVYRVKKKLDLEKQSSLATEQSLCIPISMQPFRAIHNGAPHPCFSSLSPCIGRQPDILGFPQTGLFFPIPAFVHVASSSICHLSPPPPYVLITKFKKSVCSVVNSDKLTGLFLGGVVMCGKRF